MKVVNGTLNRLVAAVLLVALCGAPAFAQAGAVRVRPAAVTEAATPRSPASAPAAASDYAAREAANPALANFTGGSTVFIGGSTVVLILLIVLIVILI